MRPVLTNYIVITNKYPLDPFVDIILLLLIIILYTVAACATQLLIAITYKAIHIQAVCNNSIVRQRNNNDKCIYKHYYST